MHSQSGPGVGQVQLDPDPVLRPRCGGARKAETGLLLRLTLPSAPGSPAPLVRWPFVRSGAPLAALQSQTGGRRQLESRGESRQPRSSET